MSSTRPYKLDRVAIRMVKEPPLYSSEPLRSPEAAVKVIADMLRQYDREAFCIVNLRNDLSPINMNIVSTGTLNASLAHPREILKSAVLSNASATMLFHNHPSGNLTPSQEDIEITDRMSKLFAMAEMPLLDHIIIGNGDQYYSFNREFWCKGYYVDTVGKNESRIAEYIKHQFDEDKLGEQLSFAAANSPYKTNK